MGTALALVARGLWPGRLPLRFPRPAVITLFKKKKKKTNEKPTKQETPKKVVGRNCPLCPAESGYERRRWPRRVCPEREGGAALQASRPFAPDALPPAWRGQLGAAPGVPAALTEAQPHPTLSFVLVPFSLPPRVWPSPPLHSCHLGLPSPKPFWSKEAKSRAPSPQPPAHPDAPRISAGRATWGVGPDPQPPPLPKVLGKLSRSPALSPAFRARGSWDWPLFYSVIDARRLCFLPDPFYYAFSFYQVYKVKYCVFITYKSMNLKRKKKISLWCFSTNV